MRNVIITAAVAVMLIPVLTARLSQDSHTIRYSQIVQLNADGSLCSGFVVGHDLIATAGHCMRERAAVQEIVYIDGKRAPYQILGYHFDGVGFEDWALVSAPTYNIKAYEIEPEGGRPGTGIVHVGHPLGEEKQTVVYGFVLLRFLDHLLLASPAIQGESGSPVLDSNNHVVGIVTQTLRPVPLSIASMVTRLKILVDALEGGL